VLGPRRPPPAAGLLAAEHQSEGEPEGAPRGSCRVAVPGACGERPFPRLLADVVAAEEIGSHRETLEVVGVGEVDRGQMLERLGPGAAVERVAT
jgi:hypothetical protein